MFLMNQTNVYRLVLLWDKNKNTGQVQVFETTAQSSLKIIVWADLFMQQQLLHLVVCQKERPYALNLFS